MSKLLLVLISIALISANSDLDSKIFNKFQKFIKKFKKNYSSINEFMSRYIAFKKNYLEIMNSEESSFNKGINEFSDLTNQEFKKKYLNLNYDATAASNFNPYHIKISNDAPESLDWRSLNRVIPKVKDMGSCGASYAFSTVGNLEGLYAEHFGKLEDLSASVIIDCDTKDSGCNGGLMEYTIAWLQDNGIMTEADYPYHSYKSECKIDIDKCVHMRITGFEKLGGGSSIFSCADEEEMKEFLYKKGPVSVALNATPLQTYSSGIIDLSSTQCPYIGINHCALLVGYGSDSVTGLDYWIVKNFWGSVWGESGYFRIRRGNGTCGINCYVITATVEFDD